jgi:hypothetical protein
MSLYNEELKMSLAQLPKLKDVDEYGEGKTCQSLIYEAINEAAYTSIRGSPWQIKVHMSLHMLCHAIDLAVDADPILKEIFERSRERDEMRAVWREREPDPS